MDLILLNQLLSQAESELKDHRETALRNKIAFIGLVIFGAIIGCSETVRWLYRDHYSETQKLIFYSFFILILVIPFALTSAYSFLPQKYLDEINKVIKKKVIFHELHSYDCQLELHPGTALPDDVLIKAGILKSRFKFSYGDDFFIGNFNAHETKISEYHVTGIFKKIFNGYVAIIYDVNATEDFIAIREDFKSVCKEPDNLNVPTKISSLFENEKKLLFIKHLNEKYYIGVKGNPKMFEYSFKKIESNSNNYTSDLESWSSLLRVIDGLTKKN